ncbi:PREDICTED: Golgi-associated olfactory signaling regulator [Crocodylus porosus]|uniref:Golgi-associated olfactory signaling regulator n=1 Tax=Crocodylus porosus TaxID=8502 RepID=UPI00093C9600|nr:PREDICTED: Golgi-associated olfactory signaling regulator [Crocodylus porosus]
MAGWLGEPRSTAGVQAMGLFLGACGLLLCLLAGVYCAYHRAARKEPFTHHRLQDATFDDLALHLEAPKDSYDWFYYDMEYEVHLPASHLPVRAQPQAAPTLPPAYPVLLKPPKDEALGPPGQEQPKLRPLKLECLSPANLPQGNYM